MIVCTTGKIFVSFEDVQTRSEKHSLKGAGCNHSQKDKYHYIETSRGFDACNGG
jgi:hypothetical protein